MAVWLLGAFALLNAVTLLSQGRGHAGWELAVLLLLGSVAGQVKVHVIPNQADHGASLISLGFALTFLTLLLLGPPAAVVVAAFGTLCSCVYPRRQPLYQVAFNTALTAFCTAVAGLVFLALNGGVLALSPARSFPAVLCACASFYLIDTGAVVTVIALTSAQSARRLWRERFLWIAPSYFGGACVGALAVIIFGRHLGVTLLFVSPVALLTYQAYSLYTARDQEKQRRLEEHLRHIAELQVGQAQLADLYLATINSLALAIDAKDPFTHQHILRVQRYAVATARQMGVDGADLEGIRTGSVLHDIGKLGVPDYVLLKPGRLTPDEFDKIKKHPEIGAAILDPVEFPWPVVPAVKSHHERWDGTGYPEGLQGEAIPLPGRILAVADVYDALTSTRSYRAAWPSDKALALVRDGAGTHFDPRVVSAFLQIVEEVARELAGEDSPPPPEAPLVPAKAVTPRSQEAAREIQRASSELLALYEVAQTLGAGLGMQETLEILASKLEALLPGMACVFLLPEDDRGVLTVRAAVGLNRGLFIGGRTLGPNSVSLRVLRERTAFLGAYDAEDLLLTSSSLVPWEALRSVLITPLVHQGEALGTLNLYHPQPEAFGAEDRQLLEMIAGRAASALYNGLLFDRTRSSALTDPLTGLYNVRFVMQHLEERCRPGDTPGALRRTDAFALLCLDLDSFKPINDLFGHQQGDWVLRDLGELFRASVRRDDVVARYGGDEFLIVLSTAAPAEAEAVAAKIREAVAAYDPGLSSPGLGPLRLGVSIGVSCFPQDGTSPAALLSVADTRMYRHKAEHKLRRLSERRPQAEKNEAPDTA